MDDGIAAILSIEYPSLCTLQSLLDAGDLRAWNAALNASASDPLPSMVDAALQRLCNLYFAAESDEREVLRRMVENETSLLQFAQRMAIRAMRTRSIEDIQHGLVAVSLEDIRSDVRDTSARILMLLHAAGYIGADYGFLFERVAKLSSARTAEATQTFARNGPAHYDLSAYFLRESTDDHGVLLEWISPF